MIENGFLSSICEIVLNKGEIKTSELRKLGISEYRKNVLMENGDLIRVRIGYYTVSTNLLRSYKESLERTKKAEEENVKEINLSEVKLVDGYTCLINGQRERGKKLIHLFLKRIGREQYSFIVDRLIDLNIAESDPMFIRTMYAITGISAPDFVYDRNVLVELFQKAYDSDNMRAARAYDNIINEADKVLADESTLKLTK